MSLPQHIWLGVSSLIFVLWTYLMFRTLFRLSRVARAQAAARGASWPSFGEQLGVYVAFVKEPEYQRTRLQLIFLTASLLTIQWSGHLLWPLSP